MYCALPSALQSMIAPPKLREESVYHWLTQLMNGLSALGAPPRQLAILRRQLRLVSAPEHANEGLKQLESLLRAHDEVLGDEWGGFARLLRSAADEDLIYQGEAIDFKGLDSDAQTQLWPLQELVEGLAILDDLAVVDEAAAERVALCLLFEAVEHQSARLEAWVRTRPHLHEVWRLYGFKAARDQLSADLVHNRLGEDAKPFALWLITHVLSGGKTPSIFERRLIDTLLHKVKLPGLATFERACLRE